MSQADTMKLKGEVRGIQIEIEIDCPKLDPDAWRDLEEWTCTVERKDVDYRRRQSFRRTAYPSLEDIPEWLVKQIGYAEAAEPKPEIPGREKWLKHIGVK